MKGLGLDLSTHVGYSYIEDGKVVDFGVKHVVVEDIDGELPDFRMVRVAQQAAKVVSELVWMRSDSDFIQIEQTNPGSFRNSQKQLEFIHYAVLDILDNEGYADKVGYVDTSAWRSFHGLKMTKEQRAHNKALKAKKSKSTKRGEGKITWKHLAVNMVNDKFALDLKLKDNDLADAILVGLYGADNALKKQTSVKKLDALDLKNFLK